MTDEGLGVGRLDSDPEIRDMWGQEVEEEQPKRTRNSFRRPDYMGSVWGEMLSRLEELRAGNELLPHGCRKGREFRDTFRVPYEFYT